MDTPTILGLAGGSLTRPMVPESNPSVLDWEVCQWRLAWASGDLHAYASVTELSLAGPEGRPWSAHCSGPNRIELDTSWHATAEAARAAVEEHVAAAVEAHLSEVAR